MQVADCSWQEPGVKEGSLEPPFEGCRVAGLWPEPGGRAKAPPKEAFWPSKAPRSQRLQVAGLLVAGTRRRSPPRLLQVAGLLPGTCRRFPPSTPPGTCRRFPPSTPPVCMRTLFWPPKKQKRTERNPGASPARLDLRGGQSCHSCHLLGVLLVFMR